MKKFKLIFSILLTFILLSNTVVSMSAGATETTSNESKMIYSNDMYNDYYNKHIDAFELQRSKYGLKDTSAYPILNKDDYYEEFDTDEYMKKKNLFKNYIQSGEFSEDYFNEAMRQYVEYNTPTKKGGFYNKFNSNQAWRFAPFCQEYKEYTGKEISNVQAHKYLQYFFHLENKEFIAEMQEKGFYNKEQQNININREFYLGSAIDHRFAYARGTKYYDRMGQEKDIYEILSEEGMNTTFIKLWNRSNMDGEFAGITEYVHDAQKARDNGFKTVMVMMLDDKFGSNYKLGSSDWSEYYITDENGNFPKEEELLNGIYEFTHASFSILKERDLVPDIVQFGRETYNGLVKNYSDISKNDPQGIKQAKVLMAVQKAISDLGLNPQYAMQFFGVYAQGQIDRIEMLTSKGVQLNLFGTTFHSNYDHGSYREVYEYLIEMTEKTNLKVWLPEASYLFSTKNSGKIQLAEYPSQDVYSDEFKFQHRFPFGISREGMYNHFDLLTSMVLSVPNDRGYGVIFWGSERAVGDNTTYKTQMYSSRQERGFFDFDNRPGRVMDLFRYKYNVR